MESQSPSPSHESTSWVQVNWFQVSVLLLTVHWNQLCCVVLNAWLKLDLLSIMSCSLTSQAPSWVVQWYRCRSLQLTYNWYNTWSHVTGLGLETTPPSLYKCTTEWRDSDCSRTPEDPNLNSPEKLFGSPNDLVIGHQDEQAERKPWPHHRPRFQLHGMHPGPDTWHNFIWFSFRLCWLTSWTLYSTDSTLLRV